MGVGQLGGGDHVLVRGVQLAVSDIIHHRAGKQVGILEHHAQTAPQIGLADLPHVDAIVKDLALVDIVETVDQVGNGGFACACGAYKGDLLAGLSVEGYVVQYQFILHIAKVHVNQSHIPLQPGIVHLAVLIYPLPSPFACADLALRQGAVRLFPHPDQGDRTFIGFRRFIHQLEDPLGACQGHYHGIELLGDLVDGHDKAAGQL